MNHVRAASVRRQRERLRGLGQNIAADTSPTCNGTWVVANAQNYSQFGMSKTEYQNTLQWGGVVWGGLLSNVSLTDANGSAFSNLERRDPSLPFSSGGRPAGDVEV